MNLCVVGRVLCFRHEYEDAIAYLEQAIRVNPNFPQAYFALAFTLTVCGRAGDAISYLDRAIELSPRDPHLASFHATRAVAHLSLGSWTLPDLRTEGHAHSERQSLAVRNSGLIARPDGPRRGDPARG